MNTLVLFFQFLKGNQTTRELLRQLTISLLTAGLVIGLVYLLRTRHPASPPEATLIQGVLKAQHRADSALALLAQWKLQHRIDSLHLVLLQRNALDSMRANAHLSNLDAMDRINRAIRAPQK